MVLENHYQRLASRRALAGLTLLAALAIPLGKCVAAAPQSDASPSQDESQAPVAQAAGSTARLEAKSAHDDVRALQGTWSFDFYYSDWWPERITNPPLTREQWRWSIAGSEIHWSGMKIDDVSLSFAVEPAKSPRQINLTFLDGPHKGRTLRGIYKFSGKDTCQICFSDPAAKVKRPANISYSTGEGRTMFFIKRVAQEAPGKQ